MTTYTLFFIWTFGAIGIHTFLEQSREEKGRDGLADFIIAVCWPLCPVYGVIKYAVGTIYSIFAGWSAMIDEYFRD